MATKARRQRHDRKGGMEGFWHLLKQVRRLLLWAFISAAAPILAGFASLYPPWPSAIVHVTALLQVIALVFIYQHIREANVTIVNRVLLTAATAVCLISVIYLVLLSQFTFTEPASQQRFVKGFACTEQAKSLYASVCPWLGDDQLIEAEWEAPRLWHQWTITVMRTSLVVFWLASFAALTTLLGAFVVYQSGNRSSNASSSKRGPRRQTPSPSV